MRINAVQRLWIVCSLFLVIPVAVATWYTVPSARPLKAAWAHAALSAVQVHDDRLWLSPQEVRKVLFSKLDDDNVIVAARVYAQESFQRQQEKHPRIAPHMLLDITVADVWYGKQLAKLRAAQHKVVATGGTVWLVLVVVAYVCVGPFGQRFRKAA
jgi:hypothetical protein